MTEYIVAVTIYLHIPFGSDPNKLRSSYFIECVMNGAV